MSSTFTEEQKFPKWMRILLSAVSLGSLIPIYYPLFSGIEGTDRTVLIAVSIPLTIVLVGLTWFFNAMTLKTRITRDEINFSFNPISKKQFLWNEVSSAKVVNYGFVGGWGIRIWTSYGTVYNTHGKMGLAIELKNGKKYLIGTQKDPELESFLKEYVSIKD